MTTNVVVRRREKSRGPKTKYTREVRTEERRDHVATLGNA
jgi:hypothetical protein